MSKEQTPIDEFLENELTEMYHNKEMSYDTYSRLHDLISIASEEEVKAKVLEALEREFSKLDYVPVMDGEMAGINYYETEVKPNYEKKNS